MERTHTKGMYTRDGGLHNYCCDGCGIFAVKDKQTKEEAKAAAEKFAIRERWEWFDGDRILCNKCKIDRR